MAETRQISSLLDHLYRKDASIEKVASEQNPFSALLQEEQEKIASDNSLASMSTADLAKLAMELEQSSNGGEASEEEISEDEHEKIAQANRVGIIMAHATVDEMARVKVAMLNGLCRVCKENPMDVEGSSICSACLQD